jgi:hypothetical protein
MSFHDQHRMAQAHILMAEAALINPLAAQASASAVGAGSGTLITGHDLHLAVVDVNGCNLVAGQAQYDLIFGQNVSPKIVLPIWDRTGLPRS